jgi:hypothetical protein
VLPTPTLTLAVGAAAAEDADDEDEDDELVALAANITTPDTAPLARPEVEGMLHADPLAGLPAEGDRT